MRESLQAVNDYLSLALRNLAIRHRCGSLIIVLWLLAAVRQALASVWALCFGAATLLVFGSKVTFLDRSLGSRVLNFTDINGHSMLAMAVCTLGYLIAHHRSS